MTIKKIRRKLQKLLFREQWSLLVSDHDGKLLKHIEPPSDRIWADPFPSNTKADILFLSNSSSPVKTELSDT